VRERSTKIPVWRVQNKKSGRTHPKNDTNLKEKGLVADKKTFTFVSPMAKVEAFGCF